MKKYKTLKKIIVVLVSLVVVGFVSFGIYLRYEHSGDIDAINAINTPSDGVYTVVSDDTIVFAPNENVKAGVIFYPGMKIRGEAYSVLADSLASNGYLCVLVNMPLNMSVLNSNAAISVIEMWPEVDDWYIGGHSMGGQVAQKCVLDNPGIFKGLITVARQIDYDFSNNDIPILGIYGSNDEICTLENVAIGTSRTNPNCYSEVIIEGGCHGYFGNYGKQGWDGIPTISREEQMTATVNAILYYLGRE